jgi:hypothetical protein
MPTKEQMEKAEEITRLIVGERIDPDVLGDAIMRYVDRDPRNALALEVILIDNISKRILMEVDDEVRYDPDMRVQVSHAAFDGQDGHKLPPNDDVEAALHMIEHGVNDEISELYDHLLELFDSTSAFMGLLSGTTSLYRRIMRVDTDQNTRIKTAILSEEGITTMSDIGNQDITPDGFA